MLGRTCTLILYSVSGSIARNAFVVIINKCLYYEAFVLLERYKKRF